MRRILTIAAALFLLSVLAFAQEPITGKIIDKDPLLRVITVDIGTSDGIRVGSAFVLYDAKGRELGCILAADVEENKFVSDLIPIKHFTEIEVGYEVEELGSGCRIEGVQAAYIPQGHFGMGDTKRDNEMPIRGVELKEFYIDKYEVTNEQYDLFVKRNDRKPPDNWKDSSYPKGKASHPVVQVDLADAKDFCKFVGKRLPTEAEWEKAARGTGRRIWPWGNVWNPTKLNNNANGPDGTDIIGSYPDDLSPYDVMDMGGNVSEWTSSQYEPYQNNYAKDEKYGKGLSVVRGGSFLDGKVDTRTSVRKPTDPKTKAVNIGFRCVKDIE